MLTTVSNNRFSKFTNQTLSEFESSNNENQEQPLILWQSPCTYFSPPSQPLCNQIMKTLVSVDKKKTTTYFSCSHSKLSKLLLTPFNGLMEISPSLICALSDLIPMTPPVSHVTCRVFDPVDTVAERHWRGLKSRPGVKQLGGYPFPALRGPQKMFRLQKERGRLAVKRFGQLNERK